MSYSYTVDMVDVAALFPGALSPKARERAFGQWCQLQTDRVDADNKDLSGVVIPKAMTVDGSPVARFISVPLTATARVDWQSDFEVVSWIWEQIHAISPVRSGRYKSSHKLLADGVEVPAPDPSITAREWIIVSPLAYSRKIEGENKEQKYLSPQAPDGVYSIVSLLASQKFKNVSIGYFYMQLHSVGPSFDVRKSVIGWASKKHGFSARFASTTLGRAKVHAFMKAVRNPAISILFR